MLIDEAHSSQSGATSDKMNEAMGGRADAEEENDDEDVVLSALRKRKMRDNASYVAFTATPKPATLEKFGEKQTDGTFKPFIVQHEAGDRRGLHTGRPGELHHLPELPSRKASRTIRCSSRPRPRASSVLMWKAAIGPYR